MLSCIFPVLCFAAPPLYPICSMSLLRDDARAQLYDTLSLSFFGLHEHVHYRLAASPPLRNPELSLSYPLTGPLAASIAEHTCASRSGMLY